MRRLVRGETYSAYTILDEIIRVNVGRWLNDEITTEIMNDIEHDIQINEDLFCLLRTQTKYRGF